MRKVAIIFAGRLASKRVPRKLLREINGAPLAEWGMRAAAEAARAEGAKPIFLGYEGDHELLSIALVHGIDFIVMPRESEHAVAWNEIFSGDVIKCLKDHQIEWVAESNVLCRPFISVDVLRKIIRQCKVAKAPFMTTLAHRGLIWDSLGKPVIGENLLPDSRNNPIYHEPAHVACCIPVDRLGDLSVANEMEMFDLDLSLAERIDIDTEDDLEFARIVAKGLYMDGVTFDFANRRPVPTSFDCLPKEIEKSCLIVCKGPSRSRAMFIRHKYDCVATVNEACLDVPGVIDYAFFCDRNEVINSKPAWPRIRRFVTSDMLWVNAGPPPIKAEGIIPTCKLYTWPWFLTPSGEESIRQAVEKREVVQCHTSTAAMSVIAYCGFRRIHLLGNENLDGSVDPGVVTQVVETVKRTARILEGIGAKFTFWNRGEE